MGLQEVIMALKDLLGENSGRIMALYVIVMFVAWSFFRSQPSILLRVFIVITLIVAFFLSVAAVVVGSEVEKVMGILGIVMSAIGLFITGILLYREQRNNAPIAIPMQPMYTRLENVDEGQQPQTPAPAAASPVTSQQMNVI